MQQLSAGRVSAACFSQVERMARTAHVGYHKNAIAREMAGGLPLPQSLSTATSRMASNAQLIEAAKAAAKQPSGLDSINRHCRISVNKRQCLKTDE
ncbi:hypothetical protein J4727_16940 [Providencia rettgeri]|uniref:Uncharacterized protein n=1 Tax=Providencia rettgeri TaxID=587 RepID=A0A939SLV9_PRORE|nr:hypothetical protein [Providencia rettgeri]